jgi:hypothetical protein
MDSFAAALDFEQCTIDEAIEFEPPAPPRTSFAVPIATGTSEEFFSSPSSLASGLTGGGKLGSTLGLLYVDIVKNVCGGVIQNSDQRRFCCKAVGSCTIKGHKSKVNLSAETLYVKHSRHGHARLEPNLPVSLISDDTTLVEMMGKDLPLEVWAAHFDALKAERTGANKRSSASSFGSASPWEDVEIPSLASLQTASDSFKTPKKLRLGRILEPESVPITNRPRGPQFSEITSLDIDDGEEVERGKTQRALQTIMSEWNRLNTTFELIHMGLDKTGISETRYRNTVSETLGELQEAIRGADAKMQLLNAGVGLAITDTDEGPMSVWDAVQQLRSNVQTNKGSVNGNSLYLEDLRKKLPNWGTTLENLARSYQTNLPKIGVNLNSLGSRIQKLESNTATGGQAGSNPFLTLGSTGSGQNSMGSSGVAQSDFDRANADIKVAFANVKTAIESLQQGTSTPSSGGVAPSATLPQDLTTKVDRALKRLGEIEGRATGESFNMNGFTFCSKSELADWLEKEKVPSVGYFWDLFSVMVTMKPKKLTGKDRSDENYSAKRTNSTTLENDLGASMTHVRPEVLYAKKGHGDLERLEVGFAACSSYAVWVTGTECYKDQLTKMLTKFCTGVLGTVSTTASYSQFVTTLMTSIRSQWHNMCTFIDSFYVELTGVAGFNKEKAWKLVGRCVAALFACLEPFRSPVTMLEDLETLDNKAACLWAVLQCHRIVSDFDLVNYRGHPAVVKEMSLFMLTERVDPSEIEACTERSKKAEKEASDAKSEIAKLKDLYTSMKRELTTAQADVKVLKAKK